MRDWYSFNQRRVSSSLIFFKTLFQIEFIAISGNSSMVISSRFPSAFRMLIVFKTICFAFFQISIIFVSTFPGRLISRGEYKIISHIFRLNFQFDFSFARFIIFVLIFLHDQNKK